MPSMECFHSVTLNLIRRGHGQFDFNSIDIPKLVRLIMILTAGLFLKALWPFIKSFVPLSLQLNLISSFYRN